MALPEFNKNTEAQAQFRAQSGGESVRNPIVPLTSVEIAAIKTGVLSPVEMPKRNVEVETHNRNGRLITERIKNDHLFYERGEGQLPWIGVSPDYFYLTRNTQDGLTATGKLLGRFLDASSRLYQKDATVRNIIRMGKNQATLDFMDKSGDVPFSAGMFRPDLCLTSEGFRLTELEIMIAGRGMASSLTTAYKELVPDVDAQKMEGSEIGYAKMWKAREADKRGAIVIVSYEDSRDFKPELKFLAEKTREQNVPLWTNDEGQIIQRDGRLFFRPAAGGDEMPVSGIDRFFETYELNPEFEMTNREGQISARYDPDIVKILEGIVNDPNLDVIPSLEHAYLEEKAMLAFLHHPQFAKHWEEYFAPEELNILRTLIPATVVVTPDLMPQPIADDWFGLLNLSGKDRELVVKKSGAAPDAWGSRSVSFAQEGKAKFQARIEAALDGKDGVTVVQKYAEGTSLDHPIYFPEVDTTNIYKNGNEVTRGRFTPFYYVTEKGVEMSDMMVTIRPGKKTHGASDSAMAPIAFI